jgi:hypothetical protein
VPDLIEGYPLLLLLLEKDDVAKVLLLLLPLLEGVYLELPLLLLFLLGCAPVVVNRGMAG